MGDCESSVSRNCLRLLRVPPTGSSASGIVRKWGRIETVLLHDRVEPGPEQAAERLFGHPRIGGERAEQDVETVSRRLLEIEENVRSAPEGATSTGQVAQRLLADAIAKIAGELQRFLEEAERVRHGVDAP